MFKRKIFWFFTPLIVVITCITSLAQLQAKKKSEEPQYRLPILMYHAIDNKKDRYSVSPKNFRSHLEQLYKAGYVTAPLKDVIAKKLYLKGKKIVILRFDGARKNQFNYLVDKNGKKKIDPECAVGIILDFYKKHPKFGKNALFVVLPKNDFQQPEFAREKYQFLIKNGMELVNHSYNHIDLTKGTPQDVDNEFGKALAHWEKLLGKDVHYIDAVATPFGAHPESDETLARLKNYLCNGTLRPQKAILYAGWHYNDAAPSPFSPEFDPFDLPSIEVHNNDFEKVMKKF